MFIIFENPSYRYVHMPIGESSFTDFGEQSAFEKEKHWIQNRVELAIQPHKNQFVTTTAAPS